jgi:hypothetical protein
MPMVFVRRVMVGMLERHVTMLMGMPLAGRIQRSVVVPMVVVMGVGMLVLHRLMNVAVFVMLGDMEPDAHGHQPRGDEKLHGQRLVEHEHGGGGRG